MTDSTPTPREPAAQVGLWGGESKTLEPIYDQEQMIAAAVEHWRQRGFPYRQLSVVECMDQINRLALADDATLTGTDAAYHVADTYHPQRFATSAVGMKAPLDAWHDDRLLARTVRLLMENDQPITAGSMLGKLVIVSGVQACANFRPGYALAMYRRFARPGEAVLDTSSGYGGRLVGYIASGLHGLYVGVDPSWAACTANARMAADLGFAAHVVQINEPAESQSARTAVEAIAAGWQGFGFAFTSPPYFTKEQYARGHDDEDRQSWRRYPEPEAWAEGFLAPMLQLQYDVLRPGAYAVLNVADVRIGSRVHAVSEWAVTAARAAGFTVEETLSFALTRRYGRSQGSELSSEPALVLRKGEDAPAWWAQLALDGIEHVEVTA